MSKFKVGQLVIVAHPIAICGCELIPKGVVVIIENVPNDNNQARISTNREIPEHYWTVSNKLRACEGIENAWAGRRFKKATPTNYALIK